MYAVRSAFIYSIPAPSPTPLPYDFLITHYTIPIEDDTFFKGCDNCYPANIPIWEDGQVVYHTHNNAFIYGVPSEGTTSGYNWGVYQEGTGYTLMGNTSPKIGILLIRLMITELYLFIVKGAPVRSTVMDWKRREQ